MVFASLFISMGVHVPYFPLWLEHAGFRPEEIAVVLDRPLADVLETLVASELRGEVERLPGGLFRGCRPTH